MNNAQIAWAIFAPFILGAIMALLYIAQGRLRLSELGKRWLNVTGLVVACVGLVTGPVLAFFAQGEVSLGWLGVSLSVSPLVRLGLAATNAAILCAMLVLGGGQGADKTLRVASAIIITSGLLNGSLLVTDQLVSTMCLLAATLTVSVVVAFPLLSDLGKADDASHGGKLLEGEWKHISMAVVATCLLAAGLLLTARHTLNLENPYMLQVGLGLVSIGLVMRAGGMPFSTSSNDLIEAAPEASILVLGAVSPAAIMMGLLTFVTLEPGLADMSTAGQQVALGLGAAGALLSGVRALASNQTLVTRESRLAVLISSSVALQIGWALFGVFSGSRSGTLGAALLAVNLALAAPLIVLGKNKIGRAVGAGALLGLPPLGGFVGTLLIAQAAVEASGVWLLVLLLGSAGVALAWLRAVTWVWADKDAIVANVTPGEQQSIASSVIAKWLGWSLLVAQALWFVVSFFIVI